MMYIANTSLLDSTDLRPEQNECFISAIDSSSDLLFLKVL